jgi:hypothetical protein
MRQQNGRAPARGPRIRKNSGYYPKDNTLEAAVLVDGRARLLADVAERAFLAGIRFALGRLAALAEADPETLRMYTRLLQAVSGWRQ